MVNRFLKLCCVEFACLMCCGLLPGASLYIQLFVQAGVSGQKCTETDQPLGCLAQYEAVTWGFTSAGSLAMVGTLPGGLIYDQLGGRWLATVGASIAILGMTLVAITVWGAENGRDASTQYLLPAGILLTDAGAILNSFCGYSLLWFFPDFQTLVIALMTGMYFLGALLPNVCTLIMNVTGCSLFDTMIAMVGGMVLALISCYIFVPTQEQALTQAREVLGVALPSPPKGCTMWKSIKNAHLVLRVHLVDHIFFSISIAIAYAFIIFYSTFLGAYGEVVLHTTKADTALTSFFTTNLTIVGGVFGPLFSAFADKSKHSTKALNVLLMVCMLVSTITVLGESWFMQEVCITFTALFQAFYGVVLTKRCLGICLPSNIGTVTGVLFAYCILSAWLLTKVLYVWLDQGKDLAVIMFSSSAIASLAMLVDFLRATIWGDQKSLVVLPDDETQLAQQYGCQSLRQVLYVAHMEDTDEGRQQLLKIMCSQDPGVRQQFMNNIDADRMEEIAGAARSC